LALISDNHYSSTNQYSIIKSVITQSVHLPHNALGLVKPPHLSPGDRIACVSLSWGGPGAIPQRYEAGKRQLESEFGVSLVPMPNALRPAEWIAKNPRARADDLMAALSDRSMKGIISAIGGDDSIRLLPFIDRRIVAENPKPFLGYSDSTVTHFIFLKAGGNRSRGVVNLQEFG